MTLKLVPVKVECYDTDTKDLLFAIEAFNGSAFSIEIDAVVNLEEWQDLSVQVFNAIKMMSLTNP